MKIRALKEAIDQELFCKGIFIFERYETHE